MGRRRSSPGNIGRELGIFYVAISLIVFLIRITIIATVWLVQTAWVFVERWIEKTDAELSGQPKPIALPASLPHVLPKQISNHQIGADFEAECAAALRQGGWTVRRNGGSGDKGADLIADRFGWVLVLQCKAQTQPVGTSAVQEAHTAAAYHGAKMSAVVARNSFTPAATHLAEKVGVRLVLARDLGRI